MVGCTRRAPGSRSHRRIAELRERARFAPEALEARKLLAVVAWDGEAGDGDFTNPLNWEGDIVPGSGDDAVIDVNGGPFIELRAGDFASVKSLMVDWPLAVNGTLGVSDQMTVGAVFFDVGPDGRLESNNLTLQASTGGITNQGEWTIGGASLIDRRIVSDGTLLIAQGATITLGIGLNAALQYGSIDVTDGVMTIRDGATITGADPAIDQIRIGTVLTMDGAATFTNVGLNADGAGIADQVRVNFDALFASTFTDSRVRFEFALVTGALDIVDSEVLVIGRAIMTGETTIEGGSVENRGMILVRAPLAAPSQANSLAINNADITMTHAPGGATRLLGNITVTDSSIGINNTARLGNGLTLRDVDITRLNPTGNGSWWAVEGSLTASDLRASGYSYLRISGDAILTLDGGTNVINALPRVRNGGLIDWTGGDLEIFVTGSTTPRRTEIGSSGALRASFTGPDAHALTITGDGRLRVAGEFSVSFDDPAAELVVNGRILNRGTIQVTGGTLRYETGQINAGQTVWQGGPGEWIVGPGGTLDLQEAFIHSSANLTFIDDAQAPFLANVTLNTGIITLEGEGDWPSGSATPFTLRNWGEIRKTGEGVRTLTGSITNLVAGTIAVDSGQLEIDSPLFMNRGTLAIGSDDFMSPRAVFRVSGDYREGGHALLQITGTADGDPDDLPRFGVGGSMSLAGDLEIVMATSTPFAQAISWQLGFASTGLVGRFGSVVLTLPGTQSSVVYTGQRFLVTIEV